MNVTAVLTRDRCQPGLRRIRTNISHSMRLLQRGATGECGVGLGELVLQQRRVSAAIFSAKSGD